MDPGEVPYRVGMVRTHLEEQRSIDRSCISLSLTVIASVVIVFIEAFASET